MTKINQPRSNYASVPGPGNPHNSRVKRLADESNASQGLYSNLKNGAQHAKQAVMGLFESQASEKAPTESVPAVRASLEAQLRNLIAHYPPSDQTMGYWNTYIRGISKNLDASVADVVAGLEAIVYLRAFKELSARLMDPDRGRILCYKIAQEVVQLLRDDFEGHLTTADLLKTVYQKMQDRNAPQEDEFNLKQFKKGVVKKRIELLNAAEYQKCYEDVQAGVWPKEEYRLFHLVNYQPVEMRRLGTVLARLPRDPHFSNLMKRLVD